MHRFEAAVNIDALLGAVRDYFERVTREFHVKGPGGGPQQPRDVEVSMPCTMPLSSDSKQQKYRAASLLHTSFEQAKAAI
jgi:hypothetical protein